jgi:PAS domain S-box-containing protein
VFKKIVEAGSDVMEVMDLDGKRLYANPAAGGVLDDPEALIGTTAADDVHPNDRDRVRQLFREVLADGKSHRTDVRLMDGKGETRIMESQWDVLRNPEGVVEGLLQVSRDVTVRRRAEESLQNLVAGTSSVTGEKFFVALVRHLARSLDVRYALVSECVNAMRDRVRAIAYWANERWIPTFEYDVRDTTCEAVIKEGRLHTYPDRVQELFPKMEALKAMHAVSYMGIPLFGSSEEPIGHLFIMDDKPLPDQGRIKYILSLFAARASVELERMHALKSLKEAEIRYRTAVEAMKDCVIVTDVHDIITYANPAMLELCGYAWKEIAGRLFSSLFLPEEDWSLSHLRTEQRLKGESEEYEIRLRRKDGALVTTRVHALPSYDDSHAVCGVIGLFRPVQS